MQSKPVTLADIGCPKSEPDICAINGDYVTYSGKHYIVLQAGGYDSLLLQEVYEILESNVFLREDGTSLFS